jgi:hypothetical protein
VPKRDYNLTEKDDSQTDRHQGYETEQSCTSERSYSNKNQFGFDRATVEAFTEGDCWRLALELHQKLDWPVFVVTGVEIAYTDHPSMYFGHMFVQNPVTGKFLDINGEHTEDELLQEDWGVGIDAPVICEVTDDLSISLTDQAVFKNIDASTVADAIIELLNLKDVSILSDGLDPDLV